MDTGSVMKPLLSDVKIGPLVNRSVSRTEVTQSLVLGHFGPLFISVLKRDRNDGGPK